MVENTREGSAQLRTPNPAFRVVQKANETVLKHRALHSNPVTPIRVDRLEVLLDGYDIILKQFLVDGFRYGFRVNFVGERASSESPNLKSALERPDITRTKLYQEPCIQLGRRKFELTNQDSAGGKNSSVLTSSKQVRRGVEIRQLFSLEMALNIHEKGFTI